MKQSTLFNAMFSKVPSFSKVSNGLGVVLVSGLSLLSSHAYAQSTAIINATVHTVAEQGVLSGAVVMLDDGKITAIYTAETVPSKIEADIIVDAQGNILTPGFIASKNLLGLVEVGAVSRTRDGSDKKADITFDASLAFNPKSTLIPYTRKGGITSNVVMPNGGEGVLVGQSFVVNLSGEFDSVVSPNNAVIAHLGAKSKGSRAMSLQTLANELADAQKALTEASKSKGKKDKTKELKRDQQVINSVVKGEKTLLAYADRATDILALLKLKAQYNLDLVLVGARDAVLVTKQIADANVPVMTSALANLPNSFDSLHSSLDNIAILNEAGIKVIIATSGESHNINQLRFDAGVAVANGFDKSAALAAVTANVADTFKLNSGRIAVGKNADLVLWSGDPFEISTKVNSMWINGEQVSTQSRQDVLRDRYISKSELPRAYIK
ncbi:amidohydrolase family protein [Colwellia sp. D2M02]|uniref:amidohydrolase family protein n=1 Tax=Colwellia sp. D2M02 TaxID=2841562 RepID=UPI002090E914|nr:amidohydrolase family protein [Colwellia sp. D2M02]